MTVTQTPAPTEALPDLDELMARLLSDRPLLDDTPDHLLQVVNVLESYGLVLDAYSRNLVFQGETQLLKPFPVMRFSTRAFRLSDSGNT